MYVINANEGIISLLQPAFEGDFLYSLPKIEFDVAYPMQPKAIACCLVDRIK